MCTASGKTIHLTVCCRPSPALRKLSTVRACGFGGKTICMRMMRRCGGWREFGPKENQPEPLHVTMRFSVAAKTFRATLSSIVGFDYEVLACSELPLYTQTLPHCVRGKSNQ